MAEPYDIKSPEEIAKAYGGNKQQIAAAMQMGVVDPTAGVLAGMFIDRMRAAQMQEQAPQATVAQQVMGGAPPAQPAAPAPAPASPSPGGLGATPQAAPPMAPPMPQMPQGPGMAAGGMVPPYASGGLSDVPVPDTMFDESSNGGFGDGYGGGGLVAFAGGSPGTLEEDFDAEFGPRMVQPTPGPTIYGYSATDPLANLGIYERLFGKPQTKYADEYEQQLLAERGPEARKKAKNQDLGLALMAMGSVIGSNRGSLLEGAAKAFGVGAPMLAQSAKERKAEERDLRKGLLDIEAGRNTAAAQRAAQLLQMQQMGISGAEAQKAREAQIDLEKLRNQGDIDVERLKQSGRLAIAGMRGSGGDGYSIPKPLSAAQTTERMGKLATQADAVLKVAREYDKAGDVDRTHNALQQYGQIRSAYKNLANSAGMPELPKPNYGVFANYNRQMRERRSKPNPGGPKVKDGFILRSATDIPQ